MKAARRRDLIRILHSGAATSQRDIVEALRTAGHDVTQATVSRDLQDIGALKVRFNGGFVYRLPEELPRGGGDLVTRNLTRTLAEFAVELRAAASLVIVKTAPGHASAVARAIDLAGLNDIAGTIAGDDTIFVATARGDRAAALTAAWLNELEKEDQ